MFKKFNKNVKEEQAIPLDKSLESIKDVPSYEKVITYMSDWIESKWRINKTPLITNIFGNSQAEVAMDEKKTCFLYPSSINVKANFQDFVKISIDSLNIGLTPDGYPVVGQRKTIVNRKYIDGFINCMNDVYDISLEKIKVMVYRSKAFPMLLVSDKITMLVAPMIINNNLSVSWEKEKYNPPSKIPESKKEVVMKRVNISLDLNRLINQVQNGGIVAVYRCPHCNGPLKIGKDVSVELVKVCEHCGSEIETMNLVDFLKTVLS